MYFIYDQRIDPIKGLYLKVNGSKLGMVSETRNGCKLTAVEKQLITEELMQLAELAVNEFFKQSIRERTNESQKIQRF